MKLPYDNPFYQFAFRELVKICMLIFFGTVTMMFAIIAFNVYVSAIYNGIMCLVILKKFSNTTSNYYYLFDLINDINIINLEGEELENKLKEYVKKRNEEDE